MNNKKNPKALPAEKVLFIINYIAFHEILPKPYVFSLKTQGSSKTTPPRFHASPASLYRK